MILNETQRGILAQIRGQEIWAVPEQMALTDSEVDQLMEFLDDDTDPDLVSEVMEMLLAEGGETEMVW